MDQICKWIKHDGSKKDKHESGFLNVHVFTF